MQVSEIHGMMQRSDFVITAAKVCDIPAIAELERECFSNPWSERSISDTMERGDNIFLVAKVCDEVAGYIGLYYVLDEGYITNVAVSGKFRRRGIARALIGALIGKAQEVPLSFVTLEVRCRNTAAIKLYENMGFVEVGIRPRFYRDPDDDARLMTYYIKK